ncbi:hypothetical protein NDU88_001993 [Pleurodeles waltl]|uniref:Uncharacterized protein n=1 Tax=Pleurodeles waltl TaxID=8319 RepID=A0AAV7M063_PLEWA|nr:hypothetical protein NDU88_001993 [Pleurodeles waltl]
MSDARLNAVRFCRLMSLPRGPRCAAGRGAEEKCSIETSRIGRRGLAFCRLPSGTTYCSAPLCLVEKEVGKKPQVSSKVPSATSVGDNLPMTPVKIRARGTSKGPPLAQKQQQQHLTGEDRVVPREWAIGDPAALRKEGPCNKKGQGKEAIKAQKGSFSVPPQLDIKLSKRHSDKAGNLSKVPCTLDYSTEVGRLISPLTPFLGRITCSSEMQPAQNCESFLPSPASWAFPLECGEQGCDKEVAQVQPVEDGEV